MTSRPRLDRGINLGNLLDACPDATSRPDTHPDVLERILAAGFQTIRISVRWTDHLRADGVVDSGFFVQVDALVDDLLTRGACVVLDVHHFDETHSDPVGTVRSCIRCGIRSQRDTPTDRPHLSSNSSTSPARQ